MLETLVSLPRWTSKIIQEKTVTELDLWIGQLQIQRLTYKKLKEWLVGKMAEYLCMCVWHMYTYAHAFTQCSILFTFLQNSFEVIMILLNHIKIMDYLNVDAYNFIMQTTVEFSLYLTSNFSLALMIYGLTTLYKLLVAIWTTMK